jgi:hypothetical protein
LPISQAFSPRLWVSRSFVRAILVGVAFAAIDAAYVSAFYLIGQRFGIEVPLDSPYDNTISTPFPWVVPLMSGLIAATTEELLFRAFAISLLLRVCKIRWIAVGIPAVLWAFLHTDYPFDPFFIRGLELTVVGIVYGILFLRYGFFAPFAAHYTYNALIGGVGLINSPVPYFKVSGGIVIALMLLPLLPAALRRLRGKALLDDNEILVDSLGAPTEASPPAPPRIEPEYRQFRPLSRKAIIVTAAAAILAGFAFYLFDLTSPPADYARVRVDRWQAQRIADAFMSEKGVDLTGYRSVVRFSNGSGDKQFDYLFQHTSRDEYKKLRERLRHSLRWYVRYFKPLDPTEYYVYILPDGTVFSYDINQPEDAPGANLSRDEALRIAEEYLRTEHQVDSSRYRLVNASSDQRPKRTDHTFVWEDTSMKVADAPCLMWLDLSGNVPYGYWTGFHLPESWVRERQQTDWKPVLWSGVGTVIGLLCLVVLLRVFVRHFTRGSMHWRVACLFGAVVAVLRLAGQVNNLSAFWLSYDIATSPQLYGAGFLLSGFGKLIGVFVLSTLGFAFCDALIRWNFPQTHPPSYWLGYRWKRRATAISGESDSTLPLRRGWGEGVVVGILVAVIWLGADSVGDPLTNALVPMLFGAPEMNVDAPRSSNPLPAQTEAPELQIGGGNSSLVPMIELLGSDLVESLGMASVIALFLVSYRSMFKGRLLPLWVLLMFPFLAICREEAVTSGWTYTQYAISAFPGFVGMIAVVFWTVRWLLRDNLASYFVLFLVMNGEDDALRLLWALNVYERANGLAVLAIVGLMIGVGTLLMCTSQSPRIKPQDPACHASSRRTDGRSFGIAD